MAEYIERDAALLEIEEWADTFCECDYVWPHVIESITKLPAADVRPMVSGKWEEDCAGAAVCSVCGEYAFETSTHHLCGWFPNYCPNCGADMREES